MSDNWKIFFILAFVCVLTLDIGALQWVAHYGP